MASKPEQIGRDRRIVSMNGKAIKKATSKFRRRQEKKLGEDAPKREHYRGYVA